MKARDFFDKDADFLEALETAEESAITAWDMEFVDGLRKKAETYGLDTFMSDAQYTQFKRLAGF